MVSKQDFRNVIESLKSRLNTSEHARLSAEADEGVMTKSQLVQRLRDDSRKVTSTSAPTGAEEGVFFGTSLVRDLQSFRFQAALTTQLAPEDRVDSSEATTGMEEAPAPEHASVSGAGTQITKERGAVAAPVAELATEGGEAAIESESERESRLEAVRKAVVTREAALVRAEADAEARLTELAASVAHAEADAARTIKDIIEKIAAVAAAAAAATAAETCQASASLQSTSEETLFLEGAHQHMEEGTDITEHWLCNSPRGGQVRDSSTRSSRSTNSGEGKAAGAAGLTTDRTPEDLKQQPEQRADQEGSQVLLCDCDAWDDSLILLHPPDEEGEAEDDPEADEGDEARVKLFRHWKPLRKRTRQAVGLILRDRLFLHIVAAAVTAVVSIVRSRPIRSSCLQAASPRILEEVFSP